MSVSVRLESCGGGGGGARAASAAGSTVSASPSKKRVIAIWAFHWHFCSKGTAVERSWSVTEVNCWRDSCCSSVRLVRSVAESDIVRGTGGLGVRSVHRSVTDVVSWLVIQEDGREIHAARDSQTPTQFNLRALSVNLPEPDLHLHAIWAIYFGVA